MKRDTDFYARIENESGYLYALYGLGLSYGLTSGVDFESFKNNEELVKKLQSRSVKLAGRGLGHDKFLRCIIVNMTIKAPRKFWHEEATYKFAERQSESTMHTLSKQPLMETDFLCPQADDSEFTKAAFWRMLKILQEIQIHDVKNLHGFLPESYYQTRAIVTNYANINNMLAQRYNHRLCIFGRYIWRELCVQIYEQLEHKELLCVEMRAGHLQVKGK